MRCFFFFKGSLFCNSQDTNLKCKCKLKPLFFVCALKAQFAVEDESKHESRSNDLGSKLIRAHNLLYKNNQNNETLGYIDFEFPDYLQEFRKNYMEAKMKNPAPYKTILRPVYRIKKPK